MSLDVYLMDPADPQGEDLYWRNITHNLCGMADAAGLYEPLWRPDEMGVQTAKELIAPIEVGLETLRGNPEKFKAFNAKNGWGKYENLVAFAEDYLKACKEYPDGLVRVSR